MQMRSTFGFGARLAASTTAALARRVRCGPARPSWSVATELAVVALRESLKASLRYGFDWLDDLSKASPLPRELRKCVRFDLDWAAGVSGEWCVPVSGVPTRTILFLHGGGYVMGSVDSSRELIARLAIGASAEVFAPNYRVAREALLPAAQDDCLAVYGALIDEGRDPQSIVLVGESAGGALCLSVLLSLRDAEAEQPAAAVLISPWVDPMAAGGSVDRNAGFDLATREFLVACIEEASGGILPTDSRVVATKASLRGLPPLLIQVGECELLLDQVRELAQRASEADVEVSLDEVEDMVHLFPSLARWHPAAAAAVERAGAFARARKESQGC